MTHICRYVSYMLYANSVSSTVLITKNMLVFRAFDIYYA